jgi:transposase
MRPYSRDLRTRVVTAYENHEGSMRQLATRFRLSLSCVRDLLTRYRATGDVAPKPHGGGYPAKLDAAGLNTVQTLVQQDPDATLKELCMRLQATTQLTVSSATMSRILTKLGLPRKKTFRAAEQERPAVQRQRAAFLTRLQQMAPEDLLFLDEAGSNQAMTRAYARAPRGQRAYAPKPVNRGVHITMLAALGLEGVVAAMTVEGFTDGAVFLAFLHNVLLPHLRPGQVVILDNLKAHKVAGVAEAIATAGARLLYLPPYSPDFSPIEECWSKIKACLRAKAARTREALEQAIAEAFETVTASDAYGWFRHAGYCVVSN